MHRAAPLLFLAATACESGLSVDYTLTLASAGVGRTSIEAPGLLRVQGATTPVVRAICGEGTERSARYVLDLGFGCLDERRGTDEQRVAWIEPLPEGWSGPALCALDPPRFAWDGLALDETVTGPGVDPWEALAAEPDPAWTQARGTGTWRRDGSPCGGVLAVEIALP